MYINCRVSEKCRRYHRLTNVSFKHHLSNYEDLSRKMRILDELLAVTKEEVDRRRVGKTISSNTKSGQGLAVLA